MNKKNKFKKLVLISILILTFFLMIYSYYTINTKLAIFSLFSLLIILLLNAIKELKTKYLLLLFYFTFFIFTMGQYIFRNNINWLYYENYDATIIIKTIIIQRFSLAMISIGFNISRSIIKLPKKSNVQKKDRVNYKLLLVIEIILFIISIIVNLDIGYRVISEGYLSAYNNNSSLPSILIYLSTFFVPLSFVLLYLVNDKKYNKLILILYFIYLCTTLLTGVRGDFCVGILIIIVYLFVKKIIINDEKIQVKKIIIILTIMFLSCLTLIVGLNLLNSYRNHKKVEKINISEQIRLFL